MAELVGKRFGNYRLLRLLGRGGFAEVYLGEHLFLGTKAAIKVLQRRLASEELQDFYQEARILAHLEHPNIIRVLDFGLEGSTPFLIMPYAPHGSLRQRHPKGTLVPLANIVSYVKEIAAALQYAHAEKLIHRDIKPENILLGRHDDLLLSDFGIAVLARGSRHLDREDVSGTITYMAPEQLRGEACPASDQYALGIVVYEWLCGACPFSGSVEEAAFQHMHASPPALCEKVPSILPSVEQVVLRALAKDPNQRFASVQDFALALEQAVCGDQENVGAQEIVASGVGEGYLQFTTPLRVASAIPIVRPIWNIPHRRNPFFTGREEVLEYLFQELLAGNASSSKQSLAISGLGGIGKTSVAVEYAYRYRSSYLAVLWARADTHEALLSDFVTLARLLNLPEQEERDQRRVLEAVEHWLEVHLEWLLILDNVEDLAMIKECIPSESRGHVLLTTRTQVTGMIARSIDLEKLTADEGALFLLRRAQVIEQDAELEDADGADYIEAKDISRMMDGLPLALDQAGAYIEETACSLSDYIDRYRRQQKTLLELRGGGVSEHPEPVATTWLLSFEKVEQFNPAAAELLRLCAFLHPDRILEEIITDGAADLVEPLQAIAGEPCKLDAAIGALRKFSLVRRNSEDKTLSIHRLVQAVLRDRMDKDRQREWAERTVRAVNRAFPDVEEVATWERCQQYLPHAQVCMLLMEQWNMVLPEAAQLLNKTGLFLLEHAQYAQAKHLLKKALDMRMQMEGSEQLDVAESLNNLAAVYLYQGMYAQAEPLLERALEIREKAQGPQHCDLAIALNNVALLYNHQGKYAEAEPLFQRALMIWEQTSGLEHPDVARTLNNLALLYQVQGKYARAELFYERSLAIWEHIRGPEHPDAAVNLNNLALLYQQQGKYTEAEAIFQRVLNIRERTLGPEHPGIAQSLNYLARHYQQQCRYVEAEVLFKQALTIRKRALGPEHPDVARTLNDLAKLYRIRNNYVEAEALFLEALDIYEQVVGPDHLDVAEVLKNYALLLSIMKRKDEAVRLARRAKAIRKKLLGDASGEEMGQAGR